jgi:hypothetical protein
MYNCWRSRLFLSWRTGGKLMQIIDRPSAAGPDPQPLRPWVPCRGHSQQRKPPGYRSVERIEQLNWRLRHDASTWLQPLYGSPAQIQSLDRFVSSTGQVELE